MAQAAFSDRLGDWINPIAVKEMRQAVKGRILTWMLTLFLLAQLVVMSLGVLLNEYSGEDLNAGPVMLSFLLMTLLVVCLLFLPAIFGIRLSSERSRQKMDLLFITDMSPYSIILGKTVAGIVLTGLLFSTSMPFLTLTYLLRGIDLPSIFIMMGLNFVVVILTIQAALLLASLPGGIISLGIRFLLGLGGAFFVLSIMGSISFALLSSGVGSLLGTWDFWAAALTIMGLIMLVMGLLYILTAVVISPPSSNRALAVRLYLFFVWCCCTVCAILWYLKSYSQEIFVVWVVVMMSVFSAVFVISLSERHIYGPRLKRRIPRSRLLRIPLFFLYSGAGGGVLFALLLLLLTLAGFYLVFTPRSSFPAVLYDVHHIALSQCLYLICYGFTALILRRLFFPKQASNQITVMIAFILLAIGSLAPFLFAWFFIYHDIDKISEFWFLGNPLVVLLEKDILEFTLLFTGIWALTALGLNVPWFAAQIRDFKPPAVSPPIPPETPRTEKQ